MQTCFSCQSELSVRGTHCPSCGTQVRCRDCNDMLEPGARACVSCGTLIGQGGSLTTNGHAKDGPQNPAVNIIEFDEDTRSRRFRAKVTDGAVDSVSHPLSLFLAGRLGVSVKRARQGQPSVLIEDPQLVLPGVADEDGGDRLRDEAIEAMALRELPAPKPEGLEAGRLREIFRERDGQLHLEEPQLRATGKLDYAQRLSYLFLYAHEKTGNESVPRSALSTILENSNVLDAHARNWISKETAIVKEDNNVRLNSAGRRAARKYLEEVFDEERKADWLPGEAGRSQGTKAGASDGAGAEKGNKSGKRGGGRVSKVTTDWVPRWKALGLVSNGYSVLKNRTPGEKGVFGLWAIRKAVGEDGKVVSESVLSNFLYHAFDTKVENRSLGRALKRMSAEKDKKVLHMGGTKFQITPDGIEEAEKLAAMGKGDASASASAKGKGASKK